MNLINTQISFRVWTKLEVITSCFRWMFLLSFKHRWCFSHIIALYKKKKKKIWFSNMLPYWLLPAPLASSRPCSPSRWLTRGFGSGAQCSSTPWAPTLVYGRWTWAATSWRTLGPRCSAKLCRLTQHLGGCVRYSSNRRLRWRKEGISVQIRNPHT